MNKNIMDSFNKLVEVRNRIDAIEENIEKCDRDISKIDREFDCGIDIGDKIKSYYRIPSGAVANLIREKRGEFEEQLRIAAKEFSARVIQLYIKIDPTAEEFEYGIENGYYTANNLPDSMKPHFTENHSAIMGIDDDDDED